MRQTIWSQLELNRALMSSLKILPFIIIQGFLSFLSGKWLSAF